MAHLLIVYYSYTGGTAAMARAACEGAAAHGNVIMKRAEEAMSTDLLDAGGYIFAAPENLAAIAGVMKAFYDRTYYDVLGRLAGRPYAQMVCAGSDGENAVRQTARIATGWRLKRVQEPLIVCTRAQTSEEILAPKHINAVDLDHCRDLGAALSAGLAMGVY